MLYGKVFNGKNAMKNECKEVWCGRKGVTKEISPSEKW